MAALVGFAGRITIPGRRCSVTAKSNVTKTPRLPPSSDVDYSIRDNQSSMKTEQLTEEEKAQAFIKDMVDMDKGYLDRDGKGGLHCQPVKAKKLDTTLRTSLESVYKFLWAARQSNHFKFPSAEKDLLVDLAAARRALDDIEDMVKGSVDLDETEGDEDEADVTLVSS
ncbi:hypothetical protein B0H13DRAFT_1853148 [Mycena leptocephala]|nr:hypothetical protein B0H13DRAFT_1853148 [Mycena leptocephala]